MVDIATRNELTVTAYDGLTADETVLRAAFSLMEAEDAELRPEDPPFAWEEFAGIQRSTPGHERRLHWLATDAAGRAVGRADLTLPLTSNTHLASALLYVHPEARGRGVGRELARLVLDAAAADGRTHAVTDIAEGHPGEQFFRRLGGEMGLAQRISRLDLTALDRGLMARWVREGVATPEYSLVEWRRTCPDELVEGYVEVKAAMNGAPVDGLPIEDRVHSVASVRDSEAELIAADLERWVLAAVHEPTGALAGFTEVIFAPSAPEHAWQGGTGVLPSHRGHGLGRWMKAAMAERILEERPSVRAIDTENAYSNAHMLAINVEMGFEILRTVNGWKGDVEVARKALQAD